MKKTLFFGLMATALGLAACSDEKEAIFTENTQKGMILNATVLQGIDTRATIDNSEEVWPFNFSSGDKVLVSNPELEAMGGSLYEFTSDATHFSCTVAQPTSSAVTWTARYPKGAVDLTNQTGKLEDVAKNYALVGSTSAPTTGASGLNIDMEAKVAILKIINGGGVISLNMKKGPSEWVTGLSADDFSVVTSTEEKELFHTDQAGEYYVVVPAGIQLSIKDGNSISLKSTTVSGFTAGKYYTMTINGAEWFHFLGTYNLNGVNVSEDIETVEFQVGVSKPATDYWNLNYDGDLWACYDTDTKTMYIQSNRLLIKGAKWGREFEGFKKLKRIKNLNLVDWTGVTDFHNFCYGCEALEEFDFTDIYTESATDMNFFFARCLSLKKVDFGNINTANVKNMNGMFWYCNSLEELDLSNFNTAKVTDMGGMFQRCEKLTEIKGLTNFNTANVTDMSMMFTNCESMESLDLSSFNTENVTNMYYMFGECPSLKELDLSSFNAANVTDMSAMFTSCSSLTKVVFDNINTANVTNMNSMFSACEKLTEIKGLSNFKTENVTNMMYMFYYCKSVEALDLSSFNTANVTNMNTMFRNCASIEKLDLSSFNTANVTDMGAMFQDCEKLTEIKGLTNFNTENVTKMPYLFWNCKSIEALDLSSFNIHKVTAYIDIDYMFRNVEKLVKLTLSDNFNLPTGQEFVFYDLGTNDNHCKIYGLPAAVQTQITSLGWNPCYFEFVNP